MKNEELWSDGVKDPPLGMLIVHHFFYNQFAFWVPALDLIIV
jgi:hypothetical protein